MERIIVNALVAHWILGIVLSIGYAIIAWITKDKEAWKRSPALFLIALTTGLVTTIPILCAFALCHLNILLNKRFK